MDHDEKIRLLAYGILRVDLELDILSEDEYKQIKAIAEGTI